MIDPQYERDGNWLYHEFELETSRRIRIQARNVRKERTGVHGTIEIRINQVVLASDTMNVERDAERVRLSNSAMKMLSELDKACWPDTQMKHAMDVFCLGLWDQIVAQLGVELLEPSETTTITRLIGSYVLEGGGTIMFSPPGRGKSYMAQAMAVSIDAGCNTIWPVRQRRALYVNLERSRDSMRFRLGCINRALGLEWNRPLPFLNVRGRSLSDVLESVRRGMEKHKCEVLFLDSISRAGMGDLTENQTGNRTVDYLNNLAPTWLALGHTPRADDKHLFGSVHFDAGMDIGVQLLAQTRENITGIGLQVTKANDIAIPPMQVIALEWGQDRLTGIRSARGHEFPEIEAGRRMTLAEEMEDYLKLVGTADGTTIADAIGRSRPKVASTLANDRRFVMVKKEGRNALYGLRAPAGYSETETG